jgi:hypothetical protein
MYLGFNLDDNKPTHQPTRTPTYFVAFNVYAMPPQTCMYCYKTLSSMSNYTRHLRTFAAKQEPESVSTRHPALGSAEFGKLAKQFDMWKLEDMRKGKEERRAQRNARYYDNTVNKDRAQVEEEIQRAL